MSTQKHSKIYLDNNASTFLDSRVCDQIITAIQTLQGNPSSTHSTGQKVRGALNTSRATIASFLGVRQNEIIFTSGGTEGINMLIKGFLGAQGSGHLITSAAEHSCVQGVVKQLESEGFETTVLSPGLFGAVTPEAVQAAIRADTKLIVLMAVNNETGVKTDIDAIAAIAEEKRIPFIVDAVAWFGKERFTIPKGVSAMAFSGHKFHAPLGVGMVFIRSGTKIAPLLAGGEQEFGKRAGTENVLGIVALGKAVELLAQELPTATLRMQELRDLFEMTLLHALPGLAINGQAPRICNVSNIAFNGVDGESLLIALDRAGIAASHGSACSSGSLEPSRVLLAMGIPLERVRSSLRFSLSRLTTRSEIEQACNTIIDCIKRLSSL